MKVVCASRSKTIAEAKRKPLSPGCRNQVVIGRQCVWDKSLPPKAMASIVSIGMLGVLYQGLIIEGDHEFALAKLHGLLLRFPIVDDQPAFVPQSNALQANIALD